MKIRLLSSVFVAIILSVSGIALAGPEKKGKVVIEHAPPLEKGKGAAIEAGSVTLEVSIQAAIQHLEKHDGDCVVSEDTELQNVYGSCVPVE